MRFYLWFMLLPSFCWATQEDSWTFQLEYMPLRYLLQTLADINHQNIALSQNISGKMDIHLQQVRWQDVWQFLMTTQHLEVQQTHGIMWVDKAYQIFPVDKEHPGIPKIVQKHLVLSYVEVNRLRELIDNKNNGLLSPLGKVIIDERTNSVWLSDIPEYLNQSLKFIQHMDVLSQQIEIEARIVSINRNCAKDLGIRLGFTQPGLVSGQLAGLHEPSAEKNLNINLPALPLELNPITYAIALAKLGQQYIDAELSALEGQGKADIIARPRLVAENQQEASISAGEDIPYQEITHSGATSVAFKKALLLLKVRPYILAGQKMLLNLEINQDADSGRRVQGVPVIATKSMNTKVLIQSGQTLVLGGIHKNDVHYEKVGLPLLKDIPVLGQIFSRQQQRLEREELLIFITPKIIGL